MNLTQLKAFVILSECLNVTETAEKLYCTQPSVSIKIRKLESSLDTVLFERSGNRLHLTEQGRIFRQYALEIMHLTQTAAEHIRQYDDPSHGKISLGASHFTGNYLLPALIAAYKQTAPAVDISLNILGSRQLIDSLDQHETDLLIMSDQIRFDPRHYHSKTFLPDEAILIVSPENPLSQQTHCNIQDILPYTFLIKPSHSETRKFLQQQLGDTLLSQLTTMEINSLEAIKHCVMHNLGISILSRLTVKHELAGGQLIEIKLEDLTFKRGISYIYHKDKHLSPAIRRFLHMLDQQHPAPSYPAA